MTIINTVTPLLRSVTCTLTLAVFTGELWPVFFRSTY